jgi:hypothetical protein
MHFSLIIDRKCLPVRGLFRTLTEVTPPSFVFMGKTILSQSVLLPLVAVSPLGRPGLAGFALYFLYPARPLIWPLCYALDRQFTLEYE